MGVDAYDFNRVSGRGFGAIATDAELVAYFKDVATKNNLKTPSALSPKIQGTRNWVATNKATQQGHPLWKYADIQLKSGDTASNNAIVADINKLASQIWPGTTAPPAPPATTAPQVNSEPYTPQTSDEATPDAGGSAEDDGGLMSKKNMMIAGGAVAAIMLVMLLK